MTCKKLFLRWLYLLHRWVGVGMCLLVLVWCASGLVMLWHTWPQPDVQGQKLAHSTLKMPQSLPALPMLNGTSAFQAFQVSMVGHTPILTLYAEQGQKQVVNLQTGAVNALPLAQLGENAQRYAVATGGSGVPVFTGLTTNDQWVLDTHGREEGFARFQFDDPQKNVVYVSRMTGDVVQATTASSRRWAWVGAIPHWLYPALLRRHPAAWHYAVIALSGTGLFLTLTGCLVGVLRLRRRAPFTLYRKWHMVHHLGGMVFGLVALSWVATGLLTMNPGGLFQSSAQATAPIRLTGTVKGTEIQDFLRAMFVIAPQDWRCVQSAFVNGDFFVAVEDIHGHLTRRNRLGQEVALTRKSLTDDLHQKNTLQKNETLVFLNKPDNYYFSKETRQRSFPVLRGVLTDGTFFYLDAGTGQVRALMDLSAQKSRWFIYGPHDVDFWLWLRQPAGRWSVVVPLLCGALLLFASGCVVALTRVKKQFR